MAEINGDLDSLNHWKVEDQKIFCCRRELLISILTPNGHRMKGKDKLTALAYAKSISHLLVLLTKDERGTVKHGWRQKHFRSP